MMKRYLSIVVLGGWLGLATLALAGCGAAAEGSEILQHTVVVEEVTLQSGGARLTFSGNIVPTETVKLSFKVAGLITSLPVAEGDFVRAEQLVAALDQSDYLIQQQAALAQYQAARMQIESEIPALISQTQTRLELTRLTYDRMQALLEAGAISQSQMDEIAAKFVVDQSNHQLAQEALAIAQTELGMAQAGYDLGRAQLDDTRLVSPIDGVVLQRVAETGEITAAGYPVLAIGSIEQVWVEIGVPDSLVNQLQVGQPAEVYVYGPEQAYAGEIGEIGYLADTTTRLFPVRILVENSAFTLKPGMIAQVQIEAASEERLCVPFASVVQLATGPVVFRYDAASGGVRQTAVTTGALVGDRIEILSGLAPGDRIVTEGQFKLKDGELVLLKEEAAR